MASLERSLGEHYVEYPQASLSGRVIIRIDGRFHSADSPAGSVSLKDNPHGHIEYFVIVFVKRPRIVLHMVLRRE